MPITRIPLAWPYNPRTPNTDRDPRRTNVMIERVEDKTYVLKRPGTLLTYSFPLGVGQGMTYYNGATYSVSSDVLRVSSVNFSGTTGVTWLSGGVADWSPRSSFGTITIQGNVYIIGGLIDTGAALNIPTNEVWSISQGTGWQQATAAAPWSPRAEVAVGNLNGTIVMIGGIDDTGPLQEVWMSSDGGSTWTQPDSFFKWDARYGATAISADDGIYLLGGRDATTMFNDIWFTNDGATWEKVLDTADWSARAFAAGYAFPVAGTGHPALWMVGGASDIAGNGINDVWYSTDGGKNWTQTAGSFGSGIYAAGYTVYNDKMWLMNGRSGPAVGTNLNIVYSSSDGVSWTQVTTSGPWQPASSGAVVIFPTATGISPYNYQTMYWLGGINASDVKASVVYYATLDVLLSLGGAINPAIASQPYQFAPFQEGQILLIKNQCGLWVVSGGKIKQVLSNGYPGETVPGLVILGTFTYVLDTSGLIHCCEADDPYTWPLLNVVGADYEADPGVALTKYLNYVVAFGTYTTQFFYDAGNPVGSPLRPYLNANSRVGCAAAATVVDMGPTIMWVGRTLQYNRQVFRMNGMTPEVVSTPAIDKLLNATGWSAPYATSYYADGHNFYLLSSTSAAYSWAYDTSTNEWFKWTDPTGGNPLPFVGSASNLDLNGFMVQSYTSGYIYLVSTSYTSDDGAGFPVELVTAKVDFGNNAMKFFGGTQLICDQNTGTALIDSSDDDGRSYGPTRTVDTSTQRPILYRCGAGRRRHWRIRMTNTEVMRWEALEVNYEMGNVQNGLAGG